MTLLADAPVRGELIQGLERRLDNDARWWCLNLEGPAPSVFIAHCAVLVEAIRRDHPAPNIIEHLRELFVDWVRMETALEHQLQLRPGDAADLHPDNAQLVRDLDAARDELEAASSHLPPTLMTERP